MSTTTNHALGEWRSYWTLPVAAGLGYSTGVLHIYGISPFIEPIQQAFEWSRTQVTIGLTITAIMGGLFAMPIGMVVDRFGPRRVGLLGVVIMSTAFALLGTATGGTTNWILLWTLLALGTLMLQATVWASAIASRFEYSRGLALAVVLSGASVGATVFPVLGAWLIANYGWRAGFVGTAALWGAIAFPMLFFFFHSAHDRARATSPSEVTDPVDLPGITLREGLRQFTFYKLILAGGMFAFTTVGMTVHFVPILTAAGTERLAAAGTAALIGIFSIIGRLGTGVLLDRFQARYIGTIAFLIPIPACLLLLYGGADPLSQMVAAAIFGLTLGSEVDVVVYLATRHFGLKNFGTLYGALLTAMSVGMAIGPLIGASIFDAFGSYQQFLMLIIGLNAMSSVAMLSLPRPPFASGNANAH